MQPLTEKILLLSPPGGLFDMTAVRNCFPDSSEVARKALAHRAVRAGEVVRLKPGLFLLGRAYRKTDPHPCVVAALLHALSHVSLEAALSVHGLIPEAVCQTASVTMARSRVSGTPIGRFTFHCVPARDPRVGVQALRLARDAWAFVASPLRAAADLVYLRPSVTWAEDGLGFLTGSLRVEGEDLRQLDPAGLQEIHDSVSSRRVQDSLDGLYRELTGGSPTF